jgi:hydroxymethylbilane synthase
LRIGTRGSDLALTQTEWVTSRLRALRPGLETELVVIKTHGDLTPQPLADPSWPLGGFVGALEQALLREEIDVAVHSHKDLPTLPTPGLVVAAVPAREVPHDVLVTCRAVALDSLPAGFRVGTASPRRAAQFRRLGAVEIVPIRGNVPTRVSRLERGEVDGVVLAAAGIARLELSVPIKIELPVETFVPAPAQGALAVQTREDIVAEALVAPLEDDAARRAVTAERAFLARVGSGCQMPVGALAVTTEGELELRGQLLTVDGSRVAEGVERGGDATAIGQALADRLRSELT